MFEATINGKGGKAVRHLDWYFLLSLQALQGATLVHGYAALYDVTPDWMPFVGPRADVAGYCDASGGSGHASAGLR